MGLSRRIDLEFELEMGMNYYFFDYFFRTRAVSFEDIHRFIHQW